jgi:hypothetical protein
VIASLESFRWRTAESFVNRKVRMRMTTQPAPLGNPTIDRLKRDFMDASAW